MKNKKETWTQRNPVAFAFILIGAFFLLCIVIGLVADYSSQEQSTLEIGEQGILTEGNYVWLDENNLREYISGIESNDDYKYNKIFNSNPKYWVPQGSKVLRINGGSTYDLNNGRQLEIYHIRILECEYYHYYHNEIVVTHKCYEGMEGYILDMDIESYSTYRKQRGYDKK